MNPSLPSAFFGLLLLAFILVTGISLLLSARLLRWRRWIMLGLHASSLAFVLAFVFFEWPRSEEAQLAEVGQYYSLDSLPAQTLAIGGPGHEPKPDYILDAECEGKSCFRGLIEIRCAQGKMNKLIWKASGVEGEFRLRKASSGIKGRFYDLIGVYPWEESEIVLEKTLSRYVGEWRPPAGSAPRLPLSFTLSIDLDPAGAAPRFVIELARPRVVELPNQRNAAGKNIDTVHLTSEPIVALQANMENDFLPTVTVSAAAPKSEINADLQLARAIAPTTLPQARKDTADNSGVGSNIAQNAANNTSLNPTQSDRTPAPASTDGGNDDFVINQGLSRIGYRYGQRFDLGGESGTIVVIAARGGLQRWQMIAAVLLLWIVPILFYLPLANYGRLFALLPTIQLMLAVRFVLGLRTYLWPPYSAESLEGGILAATLIPLLVFTGCFAFGLHGIGYLREQEGWRTPWWRYLRRFDFPPFIFYLTALIGYLLLWALLKPPASVIVAKPQELTWLSNLILIALLPPLVWRIGLQFDRQLRRNDGGDARYSEEADDPLTRKLVRPPLGPAASTLRLTLGRAFLLAMSFFALFIASWLIPSMLFKQRWQITSMMIATGVIGLLWRMLLNQLALAMTNLESRTVRQGWWKKSSGWLLRQLQIGQRTIAVALYNIGWVVFLVSALLIFKGGWNLAHRYLGLSQLGFNAAAPEALLPFISIRTNLFFEIIILILTLRLLATFFERWSQAHQEFSVVEMIALFVSPVAMYALSFTASQDWGAMLVDWPPLLCAILVITGLWPLWKYAAGRREAAAALAIAFIVVVAVFWSLYAWKASTIAVRLQPGSTITHRIILREGAEAAQSAATTGGTRLLMAIEQNWKMMNYAANGEWAGVGYGNAPIRDIRSFQQITLSDLTYSVYVLAEHGALGGVALLVLYLLFFLIVLLMAWDALRDEPLRLALVCALSLMIVFPAIYMGAANVGEWLFTGQDMPLLGLRSRSDILRTGLILVLLLAALKPITVSSAQSQGSAGWLEMIKHGVRLLPALLPGAKTQQMRSQAVDPRGAISAMALNLALVALLILVAACFPISGILRVNGKKEELKTLDLTDLKNRARTLIERGQIWFEPVAPNIAPGKGCAGGELRNRAIDAPDQTAAYELCIGGNEDGTLNELVNEWNKRERRGDSFDKQYDQKEFFKLKLESIARTNDPKISVSQRADALIVSPDIYHWSSPFNAPQGWNGALTDESSANNRGGALIGAGLVLPLRAIDIGVPDEVEPVQVGAGEEFIEKVVIGNSQRYVAKRKFEIYEKQSDITSGRAPIFKVETVKGAEGAVLRSGSGDFDLFVNGSSLLDSASGVIPPIRLDFGDVIAYAPRHSGRPARVAPHVFTYSRVRLGVFSYQAWLNGETDRVYTQGPLRSLAEQITKAIIAAGPAGQAADSDVTLTLDTEINREMDDLLNEWRGKLDKDVPLKKVCSRRRMSITLMETETGKLLALASNPGKPKPPESGEACDQGNESANLNFVSHRIGSAVKPFTAAATLESFPDLVSMTVIDNRQSNQQVLGLPVSGKRGIAGRGGDTEITWDEFLPHSDNLYAVALSLLGMCDSKDGGATPRFRSGIPASPFRLTLTPGGSLLGDPVWANEHMFDSKTRAIELLDQTPLARNLQSLFGVRADYPAVRSARYDTSIWSQLQLGQPPESNSLGKMNLVSPEIPNLALADVRNFDDLRSFLLGGEIDDLPEYGRVGSAWSNVYLTQSLARIVTGRKIKARIVASPSEPEAVTESRSSPNSWRQKIIEGLAGVVSNPGGTAWRQLASYNGNLDGKNFKIIGKTGTLDPDNTADKEGRLIKGELLSDSIFIFTAGIWDGEKFTGRSITGAIYLEQGGDQQAQRLAADLIRRLNNDKTRFQWGETR